MMFIDCPFIPNCKTKYPPEDDFLLEEFVIKAEYN
jgi:hypothetical protein